MRRGRGGYGMYILHVFLVPWVWGWLCSGLNEEALTHLQCADDIVLFSLTR